MKGAGRVHVAGNAVASGYAGTSTSLEHTAFLKGAFLTSDIGRFDENGCLYLTGRVSSFINVSGRKVNPMEVEKVLLEIPGVTEAKVLGVPCEIRGERLLACLVPKRPGISRVAIRKHCSGKLSAYKIPREIIFLDSLPVDSRGKVSRRLLEKVARNSPSLDDKR